MLLGVKDVAIISIQLKDVIEKSVSSKLVSVHNWDAAARLPKLVMLVKCLIFFSVNHMVICINQFVSKKSEQSEQSSEFDLNSSNVGYFQGLSKIKKGVEMFSMKHLIK